MVKQLDLWPEEIKIRDTDRVDLSTLKDLKIKNFQNTKNWNFKDIPKEKYFIYKTGGTNPFLKEEGTIFPYLINTQTINHKNGGLISPSLTRPIKYPRWNLSFTLNGEKRNFLVTCHSLAATAFIEQGHPSQTYVSHCNEGQVEDHYLWYNIPNLKWATPSQNNLERFRRSEGGLVDGQDSFL
tara:strand:+ start:2548 stop:3096 length:549 start_codon:yes stop_codon:yes gene_type:complete